MNWLPGDLAAFWACCQRRPHAASLQCGTLRAWYTPQGAQLW